MRPVAPCSAVLRLDVNETPYAIARVTTILTARRFDVLTLDVGAPAGGRRRMTVELAAGDDLEVRRAVKYLHRSPDVLKVVHLPDEESHARRAAFVVIDAPAHRLPEVVTVAQAMSAEIVEAGHGRCTLFLAAEPDRVAELVTALGDFPVRDVVLSAPVRTRTLRRPGEHGRAGQPGTMLNARILR